MKEAQQVTKAKIKRAVRANLKGLATNKLYRRLTVQCSKCPPAFSLKRIPLQNLKKHHRNLDKVN